MSKRRLTSRERQFFTDYLRALESAGIPGLLLRNYDDFPESIGNDLDLFVPRADLDRAEKLFRDLLRNAGGELLMRNPRDYFLDLRFLFDGGIADALHLDLYHGAFVWHGQEYLAPSKLVGEAVAHPGGFRIPRPAHEALNLVMASLLWGGFFKSSYQPRIARLLSEAEERAEFDRCVESAFGRGFDLGFDPSLSVTPSVDVVRRATRRLRRGLKRTSWRRNKVKIASGWLSHWCAEIRTLFRPRGLQIAVLGPDGSGKSTVIAVIRERFSRIFVDTHLHHWRPGILPEIGVLLGRRAPRSGPVEQPHGEPPHLALTSFFRLLYYLADYWIGFGPCIWKRRAQSHLVIFDRYAEDMGCDPKRYRLGLPKALVKAFCRLTPRPDFTFVLLTDAATIAQRKWELPPESVKKILNQYRTLADSSTRYIPVDASRSVADVSGEIEKFLHLYLLNREQQ